ncbi:MAG: hypothetical protein HQP61_02000 [Peptococcaceae bacterium]|nr:hypothetical protein [Candidatus Syntrophopropionicum ammoniitolerans]
MYVKLDEVILVEDHRKLEPSDPVVYERMLRNERIFTLDDIRTEYDTGDIRPYGRMYKDAGGRICIVPDSKKQFEEDCWLAKDHVSLD